MKTEPTFAEIVDRATVDDAIAWKQDPEQWIFCTDMLGISSHADNSDFWVNKLEDKFNLLLGSDI